jgi:hypothetical protein
MLNAEGYFRIQLFCVAEVVADRRVKGEHVDGVR